MTELKFKPTNRSEQNVVNNFCRAIFKLFPRTYTGMSIANKIFEVFTVRIDWHDCSTALDELDRNSDQVKVTGCDQSGMWEYQVIS